MDDRKDVNKRVLSHSSLGWFKRSPAYFKYMIEQDEKIETDALIFGNVFHTMVLEPKMFDSRYFVLNLEERPEKNKTMASKENKLWKQSELEKAGDKRLIGSTDKKNAENMAESLFRKAGDLIRGATEYERRIDWRREGVDLKGFIDIDHDIFMADLKTAADATPHQWQRKAYWDFNSHRQAAMYLDGDAKGLYTGDKDFYFIVVEKKPPYLVSIHLVGKNKIAEGMTQYKELIKGVKACRKSGKWMDFDPIVNVWE